MVATRSGTLWVCWTPGRGGALHGALHGLRAGDRVTLERLAAQITAGDYPAGAAIFVQDDCPGCTRRSVRWLARLAQRGRRGYGQSTADATPPPTSTGAG